ncbi:MAG: hypothetical protein K0Q51_595 [Rickettsiaceae bacterium]|jgi:hypothetical protein|nr:hypothetical protein [Rickettsiaceae bacterium]
MEEFEKQRAHNQQMVEIEILTTQIARETANAKGLNSKDTALLRNYLKKKIDGHLKDSKDNPKNYKILTDIERENLVEPLKFLADKAVKGIKEAAKPYNAEQSFAREVFKPSQDSPRNLKDAIERLPEYKASLAKANAETSKLQSNIPAKPVTRDLAPSINPLQKELSQRLAKEAMAVRNGATEKPGAKLTTKQNSAIASPSTDNKNEQKPEWKKGVKPEMNAKRQAALVDNIPKFNNRLVDNEARRNMDKIIEQAPGLKNKLNNVKNNIVSKAQSKVKAVINKLKPKDKGWSK